MVNIKRNLKNDLKRTIRLNIYLKMVDNIAAIRKSVMEGFSIINAVIEDQDQIRVDFSLLKELFLANLISFEFLPEADDPNELTIILPNIDNFDFTDLEVLELILEGVVGEFVEISDVEFIKIFGNAPDGLISTGSIDGGVIYLIPYTDEVDSLSNRILGHSLNMFPFSNSPPICKEFFGKANIFIENKLKEWVPDIIKNSLKGVTDKHGGK